MISSLFAVSGCEAVLGVDSLTERGSGDGGDDSADATTADGGDDGMIQLPEAGSKHDGGVVDATSPEAGPTEGGSLEAGPEAGTCATGQADCDHNPANGCESTLASDPKNCGMCGHDCTALAHVSGSGVTCSAGVCVVPASACTTGYAHCSANPDDGCEADLGTPQTCGTCTNTCSGATPDCSTGSCTDGCTPATLMSCSGSCVDTTQSPTNCGMCGNACPVPAHSTASCAMNACSFNCAGPFHQCGAVCADNTSPTTCGTSCTPCADPPGGGGAATCTSAGACSFGCDSTHHSCDGVTCSSNGDAATCGSSCTPCPVPTGATMATCSDNTATATCGVVCDSTHHTCDNGITCSDSTQPATCGTSCTPCSVPANTTGAACNSGTCGYLACSPGYGDCDGNAANGCEVNLTDSGLNCNACGHSCLGGTCTGGACQPIVLATAELAGALTLDSQNVYFLYDSYLVGSVPKVGGTAAASRFNPNPLSTIVYTDNELYIFDDGNTLDRMTAAQVSNQLVTADYSGAGTNASSPLVASQNEPFWINSNLTNIEALFVRITNPPTADTVTSPYAAPGANLIELLAAGPDGYLVWVEKTSASTARVMGGTPFCTGVIACSLTGTQIAVVSGVPTALYADATYIYYFVSGTITTMTRAGAVVHAAAIADTSVSWLVADGTNAYWDDEGAFIHSVPLGGGVTSTVATAMELEQLAIDTTALYWTDRSAGEVMKIAK